MENNNTKLGAITFVNLCPHDVTVTDGASLRITFKASGQIARLDSTVDRTHLDITLTDEITISLPVQEIENGVVHGLPKAVPGIMYITSYIVAKHVCRADVISPLTDSTAIRSEDNKVIGVKGFQRFA